MADRATRIKLLDINELEINPSTKEKQDEIINALGGASTYDTIIDETSTANITYIGKANIGSITSNNVWQIMRINEISGTQIGWANNNTNFTNIWDNRTSLSYSK